MEDKWGRKWVEDPCVATEEEKKSFFFFIYIVSVNVFYVVIVKETRQNTGNKIKFRTTIWYMNKFV